MAHDVKLNYSKYGQEKFTVPDEHTKKINASNKNIPNPIMGGGSMPSNLPVDDSQSKKSSGV